MRLFGCDVTCVGWEDFDVNDDDLVGVEEYPAVMPMMAITRRVINAVGEDCRVMVEVFSALIDECVWSVE